MRQKKVTLKALVILHFYIKYTLSYLKSIETDIEEYKYFTIMGFFAVRTTILIIH
jgi:hypothetical protein